MKSADELKQLSENELRTEELKHATYLKLVRLLLRFHNESKGDNDEQKTGIDTSAEIKDLAQPEQSDRTL